MKVRIVAASHVIETTVLGGVMLMILAGASCGRRTPVAPVNLTSEGFAVKGYDPVAYFVAGKPVRGSAQFEYLWNGARWRFSSAEDLEIFKADPKKYAPKYGGYCAYAVSQGKTADIDPEAWTVFAGRLYLNLDKNVQKIWDEDMREYIRRADMNWPRMIKKGNGT